MTSKNIISSLFNLYSKKGCGYFSCNTHALFHEADFIAITKSEFIIECEIKISRSDFFADFTKSEKHKAMIDKACKCNYFYFAVPQGLINLLDVPAYAGLIEVYGYKGRFYANILKPAPRLHSNKIQPALLIKLLRSVMYKFFNHGLYEESKTNNIPH